MKVIILTLLACLALSDFVSEEWTGGQTLSYDLCNFEDMSGCDLSVTITYRADNEMDVTKWYEDGSGTEKKIEKWEDEERLTLKFDLSSIDSDPLEADDYIRCLACLNVDENSDLRDGDTGFAACWKVWDGNLFDTNGEY